MFGNAPRALWEKLCPPDEENRISLSCRALLVERGDEKILLETGIGVFFPPALRQRFGVFEPEHVLLRSLAELGLSDGDITTVVLSHLHFDHAGGLLAPFEEGKPPRLLFPRARFVVSQAALARAEKPHSRDRASFIAELPALLEGSARLVVVARDAASCSALGDGYRFWHSDGHTPGLLLTEVAAAQGPVLFAADLIPGAAWVHVPITMGYDRYPELLIGEKERLLRDLHARGGYLFFTHDPTHAMGKVALDGKGKFTVAAAH